MSLAERNASFIPPPRERGEDKEAQVRAPSTSGTYDLKPYSPQRDSTRFCKSAE